MYILLIKGKKKIKQNTQWQNQRSLFLDCKNPESQKHESNIISVSCSNFTWTLFLHWTFMILLVECVTFMKQSLWTCSSVHDLCSHYCGTALQIISQDSHNLTCSVTAHWCQVRNCLLDHVQHQNLQDKASHLGGKAVCMESNWIVETRREMLSFYIFICEEMPWWNK